jgi:VCBS repeat protein/flagellar hook capping protein FlgD
MNAAPRAPRAPLFHASPDGAVPAPSAARRARVVLGASLLAALVLPWRAGPAGAQALTEVNSGLPAPPFPCAIWGDYDSDGDLDVLVAGLGKQDIAFTTLYRNTAGTFANSGIALLGLSRASAAWGDFDGDGDLDLAMTGLTTAGIPTTRVYRNDGGTTFTVVPGTLLGVMGGNVAWGDYDGDGDLDLLVTGVTSTVPNVGVAATRLYRNDGGTFTSVAHPFPNCYLGAVAWGDYDNDGRVDVVITGTSESSALFANVWHNDGGGSFSDAGAALPGADLGPAAWGDYDGDGDLDLLFGGNSNVGFITTVYRNDGGTFVDAQAGLLGLLWASAAWADFDGDGDLDLMVSGYDAVAQVPRSILYRNDAGSFVDSGVAFHNLYLGTLAWGDYDNDGDPDLLLAGNDAGHDLLSLYRNNGVVPNAAPGPPSNLALHFLGAGTEFSWSAGTDDHTPPAGLTYNLRIGTTPGGAQIVSPHASADGHRLLPAMGNAQSDLAVRIAGLQPGNTYYWSVQSVDNAYLGSAFAPEASFTYALAVGDEPIAGAITVRALPNPFARATTLHLRAGVATTARVVIFDTHGRRVRTLWQGRLEPGDRAITWDGRDRSGAAMPVGIYLVRLEGPALNGRAMLVKLE